MNKLRALCFLERAMLGETLHEALDNVFVLEYVGSRAPGLVITPAIGAIVVAAHDADARAILALAATVAPRARRVAVTDGSQVVDEGVIEIAHAMVASNWQANVLLPLAKSLQAHHQRVEPGEDVHQTRRALETQLEQATRDLDVATTKLHKLGEDYEQLSYRDAMTGLYNQRAFHERLLEEVARATRFIKPLTLLFVDIDSLSAINRKHGLEAGDEIITRVARLVSTDPSGVRGSDVVARYSGEEFVILLTETDKAGALTKAMRLRDAVRESTMPGDARVTISVGVASIGDDASSADDLISAAQAATQGAKSAGGSRVHFYDTTNGRRPRETREPASSIVAMPAPTIERFRPYHDRIPEIVHILRRDRSLSCLLVDLSRLRRLEQDIGIAHHSEIIEHAGEALDAVRGTLLTHDDLICRTSEGDAYVIILNNKHGARSEHLTSTGRKISAAVESALTPMVFDLVRDRPRIVVGNARIIGNNLVRPERQIAQLISDATDSAAVESRVVALHDKSLLQDVIMGDGLTTVVQPIVHLASCDIFGFEALTRGPVNSPMHSPATLFSVADEVGLTHELDRACFRGAVRAGAGLEPVHRLFVNLLPMSFYDTALIEIELSHLLEAAALTPANIVFEITEKLAIEDFSSFRRALANYAAMGFGIAIDDVGTRHSNLETIMALRPNFLKLSDVLTRGVSRSTVKREMLRSLGRIGDAIDAVIVAEGIETAEDLVCLRDLGIRYGQGYFIARPGAPFPAVHPDVQKAMRDMVHGELVVELDDDADLRDIPHPSRMPTGSVPQVFTSEPTRPSIKRGRTVSTGDFGNPLAGTPTNPAAATLATLDGPEDAA